MRRTCKYALRLFANACPPEDVGPPGYFQFLEAIHNPAHEQHAEMKQWLGRSFDPLHEKVESFQRKGVNAEYRLEDSVATPCGIAQEAGKNYSLVVMGTRGRNRLLTAFLGSTAREMIRHALVPVVIVHSGHYNVNAK